MISSDVVVMSCCENDKIYKGQTKLSISFWSFHFHKIDDMMHIFVSFLCGAKLLV